MTIRFLKLHLHHFLSFDDSTIDLSNKGYCLVVGVNRNPKDAAKSNGSGKSTIWNALSYALVGETLSGLKTGLANNYFNDGCYVEVEFEVDGHNYKLTRSKDDDCLGTNLKIVIDGEDKSGKGIRESQALLDQYLPDLTGELIGSVIMLGQGLPQKFTSNSPSGRKEVLEHLSKSDFMIQDLKDRIDVRLTKLHDKSREIEDSLLSLSSKKTIYNEQLEHCNQKLEKLSENVDFDSLIAQLEEKTVQISDNLLKLGQENDKLTEEKDELNEKIAKEAELKQQRLDKIYNQYVEYNKEILDKKSNVSSDKQRLEKEIQVMKSVKDVCPLCGQKIPNVVKQDTSAKEQELAEITEVYDSVLREEQDNNEEYKKARVTVEEKFNTAVAEASNRLKEIAFAMQGKTQLINSLTSTYNSTSSELTRLKAEKENHDKNLKEVQEEIEKLEKAVSDIDINTNNLNEQAKDVSRHTDAVNKMNTLIKRDFRGVLLSGIIDFINAKAKEYASKIFNSNNLEFILDGNNIDIMFENKDYDNLSGGEKQRVDLIVQFAIRDMMTRYLGFSSNILVLDEITDALDSVSCDKVINFITEELKDVESVFIISHHADELSLPEDCRIIIEKNELGVSGVK